MKKRKAFTLIELLAVIVILAIIAFIATPIVLNVIDHSQKKADLNSAYGLIDAGRLYYAESLLDEKKKENLENYTNLWSDIVIQGEKPKNGYLYVDPKGNVALSVVYRSVCYQKEFQGELELLTEQVCGLSIDGNDKTPPTVTYQALENPFNEFDWAKNDFYVQIRVSDDESGVAYFDWCQTTENFCIPTTRQKGETGEVLITSESQKNIICVTGTDQMGNQNDLICSKKYALDKTNPVIDGLEEKTIPLKEPFDLKENVVVFDKLSGIEEELKYQPEVIDQTMTKTTEVTYTISDRAGNETIQIRKITTVGSAPNVIFNVLNNPFNEFGWSKSDFFVEIEGIDNSGHGIKEMKWCVTTSDSCDPILGNTSTNSQNTVGVTVESSSNHICVIVTDEDNVVSERICSETYKLDKTNPNFSGIRDITVTKDTAVDLKENIISDDILSGINGMFQVSPGTVDTSKSGINEIIYKVVDYAGNEQINIRKVIVTAEAPTVTFETESGKINESGWGKENFFVTITANDQSGHGIKEFQWCSTTGSSCDPSLGIVQTGGIGGAMISVESSSNRICVIATDNTGKRSTNICSDTYKLDKTAPVFNGVGNQNVTIGNPFNPQTGVSIVENGSGINGSYTYQPSSVNTNAIQNVTITYQVSDIAGNTTSVNRIISVIGYMWQKYNAVGTTKYYWDVYDTVTTEKGEAVYLRNEQINSDPLSSFASNYVITSLGGWGFSIEAWLYTSFCHIQQAINEGWVDRYPYMQWGSTPHLLYKYISSPSPNVFIAELYEARGVTIVSKGGYLSQVESTYSGTYPNDGVSGWNWYVYKNSGITYTQGATSYGTVTSSSSTAYPTNGRHSDGYWYVRM